MDRKLHWERVYAATEPTEASWYQSHPTRSLELLRAVGVGPRSMIIDVGGGDSALVDTLVEERMGHITVLDISGAALARARTRLGARAGDITWLEADVTRAELPPNAYDVWHDRATFHFLTELDDRECYVATAAAALRSQGTLIVATFAPNGPTHCSGLDVARYDIQGLAEEFGEEFTLLRGFGDVHRTPTGAEQSFTYAVFRRR